VRVLGGEVTGLSLGVLHSQAEPSTSRPCTWRSFMRQRARCWIMPEADIVSLLRLIDESVSSPRIEVRHRDANVVLRRSTAPIRVRWCHRNGPDRSSLLW
jgi:hypothetical protein